MSESLEKDENEPSAGTDSKKKNFDELEKRLVWIFGTPRSGSTWLATEILQQNRIRIINELMIGAQLGAFFDNPQVHWNLLNGNYMAKFTRVIDRDSENSFFNLKYEKAWKRGLRNLLLERISAQYGFAGYDQIIMKSPNESHASDIILKCLPKSKLIFLIRDGRDVIDSRQGKFQNPREGQKHPETPEERRFRISHFALMWNIMIEVTTKAYEQHDPDLRILVKYEDLRTDSFNQIKRIYDFLGKPLPDSEIQKIVERTQFENVPEDMRGEDKNIRKAKPGGYTDYFTNDEIKLMNKIMKDNLKKYGYSIDE